MFSILVEDVRAHGRKHTAQKCTSARLSWVLLVVEWYECVLYVCSDTAVCGCGLRLLLKLVDARCLCCMLATVDTAILNGMMYYALVDYVRYVMYD